MLQGFVADVRSSGTAELAATIEGPLEDPALSGTLDITDGRIRHFALPHALENVSGTLRFDTRGVTLDGLTGRLARGDVTFGGRIDKQGYLPGQIDITMTGTGMRLRLAEGMQSLVDAQLSLQGTHGGGDALRTGHRERRRVRASVCVERRAPRSGGGRGNPGHGARGTDDSTALRHPHHGASDVAGAQQQPASDRERRPAAPGHVRSPAALRTCRSGARRIPLRGAPLRADARHHRLQQPAKIEPFFDLETETRVRVPGETYRVTVRATGPWVPVARVLGRSAAARTRAAGAAPERRALRVRTSSSVSTRA